MLRLKQIVVPLAFLALIALYFGTQHRFKLYQETNVADDEINASTLPSRINKFMDGASSPKVPPLPPPKSSTLAPLYPPSPPSITIIAIWTIRGRPVAYLDNFFGSVGANPQVDVLFVKYDINEVGCDQPLSHGIPNVREICLSIDEYWDLHADFLCDRWNCDEHQREVVDTKLRERAHGDRVRIAFVSVPNRCH